MQRKSFEGMKCPIARSLQHVGEWWSMLILREALSGFTRFDDLERNLGIAPSMLTRRLKTLVDAGLLERHAYSERPKRYEYRPTERGRDFGDVLLALLDFGNRHFAPEGRSVTVVHAETGVEAIPVLIDANTGLPLNDPAYRWAAGPAAGTRLRARYMADRRLRQPGGET